MAVNARQTTLHRLNGTTTCVAPLREGAVFANPVNAENGVGWNLTTGTGLRGGRIEFASTDFSSGQYMTFQMASNTFHAMPRQNTLANGGTRIVVEDSSGNWARWNIHGNDIDTTPQTLGVFKAFAGVMGSAGQNPDQSPIFFIDKSSTPDASSGSVDWSDLAAVELTANIVTSGSFSLYIALLGVADRPLSTGGTVGTPQKFRDFWSTYFNGTGMGGNGFATGRMFVQPSVMYGGAQTAQITCTHGFQIGDGVTTTNFSDSNFELVFYPTQKTILTQTLRGYGVAITDTPTATRDGVVNLAAGSTCNFNTFAFSGAPNDYNLRFIGAAPTLVNGRIFGAKEFELLDCNATLIEFNTVETVTVNEDSTLSGCFIRSQPVAGKGLYIIGDPDTYSNLDIECGDKLTILAPSAGTYDLSAIKFPVDVTIHNESATNAITVILTPGDGVTITTSTVGGTVTIETPPVTISVTALDSGTKVPVAGAAVYIEAGVGGPLTQGTIIVNDVTDAFGVVTASSSVLSNQPIQRSSIRSASGAPNYTAYPFAGTISSISGFTLTALLINEDA